MTQDCEMLWHDTGHTARQQRDEEQRDGRDRVHSSATTSGGTARKNEEKEAHVLVTEENKSMFIGDGGGQNHMYQWQTTTNAYVLVAQEELVVSTCK